MKVPSPAWRALIVLAFGGVAATSNAAAANADVAAGSGSGLLARFPRRVAFFNSSRNHLLATPPRGWMSWELFRCGSQNGAGDDGSDPLTTYQISSALLRGQADAMATRGFRNAGYTLLSIDDCVSALTPTRP